MTLNSVTLSGNQADSGGGIYNDPYGSTLTVSYSTLSGNSANYGAASTTQGLVE